MKQGDVKPGMFITFESWTEIQGDKEYWPACIYIIKDEPKQRSWLVVDLNKDAIRYMSYYAITKDAIEYEGDVPTAKKIVIQTVFKVS